ncbi:MAG: sulfatase [Lentisphaerae bacterium]|jgi:arylsulfatase A-like enzyme|nr:sulfatase [Lentisphaerota bacterium]MBT4814297.1 sulfatase [Lentisphaerota bacterium]MBT5609122.1 sulfatase [Lentisphaerota bacterium]MBT7058435.1 sulfatase [Lentisphaerota bacterium]MBT7840347.1 sulfatase [Lentisphaerota bacterium]
MLNIVLIITDTFRYDNIGDRCPAMPVRTPALDRFAAEQATEIHGFFTGSFPTIPHRTDIATGRLGWPNYGWQAIDQSSPNHVGSILRQKGYVTQLICDCPHLFNSRFQHGFDAAFQNRGQEGDKPLLHLNDPIAETTPPEKTRSQPMYRGRTLADTHRWTNRYFTTEGETFCAKTGNTVVRWLEENSEAGPFFLWVDFFDPHEPWDAPEYLVRRYDPDYVGPPMLHPNYGRSTDYTDGELRNLRAHYAAEAELVDRYVGRVLQKIDDLRLWENTVVVVTSDHGMSLGEHSRTGKTNISSGDDRYWPIYPEIGHVPFLIAAPQVAKGGTSALLAQPMDILPTLADLAGTSLDPPQDFHGLSFAGPLCNGGEHREVVVSGSCLHPQASRGVRRKATTPFAVTKRWGYTPVGAEGGAELFDLSVDPLAARNVAADNPRACAELQAAFLAHLREHDAPTDVLELWLQAPLKGADGVSSIDYE